MIDSDAEFDRAFRSRAPALDCRPQNASDAIFLTDLFIACSPLAAVLPEPMLIQQAGFQRAAHDAAHPCAMRRIATFGDVPVGRIMIDWGSVEVYGVDLAVLPEFRSIGAGLHLLRSWIEVIDLLARPARLEVRADNSAAKIYSHLGFVPATGEDATSPFVTMLRPARLVGG